MVAKRLNSCRFVPAATREGRENTDRESVTRSQAGHTATSWRTESHVSGASIDQGPALMRLGLCATG